MAYTDRNLKLCSRAFNNEWKTSVTFTIPRFENTLLRFWRTSKSTTEPSVRPYIYVVRKRCKSSLFYQKLQQKQSPISLPKFVNFVIYYPFRFSINDNFLFKSSSFICPQFYFSNPSANCIRLKEYIRVSQHHTAPTVSLSSCWQYPGKMYGKIFSHNVFDVLFIVIRYIIVSVLF